MAFLPDEPGKTPSRPQAASGLNSLLTVAILAMLTASAPAAGPAASSCAGEWIRQLSGPFATFRAGEARAGEPAARPLAQAEHAGVSGAIWTSAPGQIHRVRVEQLDLPPPTR